MVLPVLRTAFSGKAGTLSKAGACLLILMLNLSNHNLTKPKWVGVGVGSPLLETATETSEAAYTSQSAGSKRQFETEIKLCSQAQDSVSTALL